ncbi:MLO-like protein 15 isoform X1 [Syzygium oleosum]|uniref:MLO-like protein 15 isoform X1 n=1 Tax=Syzygium oleosum TaxID=219896 RepID=UPI0024BBC921|nr:MLO-like protein 15 isoform X1 [Syzygium oleosum]
MVEAGAVKTTLEFTSTWVVAVVCCVMVLISFLVHRFLQFAGQLLSRPSKKHPSHCRGRRKHLFDALQKIKEELMQLGFISLLLSVFQTSIGKICIAERLANVWLPCHQPAYSSSTTTAHFSTDPIASDGYQGRQLVANTTDYCVQKGKVPLLSLTALHHLHIFIFVLATFHVIVCVVIILCGEAKLYHWRQWDKSIIENGCYINEEDRRSQLTQLAKKDGRFFDEGKRLAVIGWLHIFGKHFFPSVTKLEYIAIRLNCIKAHKLKTPDDDFQNIIRRVQKDFDKVVGISWYLWLFVVLFLLLNVSGWNAYFWISFLPLTLLLVVGAKLEHVVTQKMKKITEKYNSSAGASISTVTAVEFSDDDFWFHKPHLVLDLIHIILFQNSFELAFFFFILFQYDFNSCIMGEVGYVIPRLVIGVSVQFMCSYRTLPLYAIMKSQMSRKQDHSKEEREMKVVTWIWDWIERDSRKVASSNESTQAGSREGLAANEQTKAGEIESEMEADIEAQDGTKPSYTLEFKTRRAAMDRRISFAPFLSFRGP